MAYLRPTWHKELSADQLKYSFDPKEFDFESTSTVKPIETIIGQERAIKALRLGVELRSQGYNIFITGISGTGKFTSVKRMLETLNPDCTTMDDYAYVNNFKDDDQSSSDLKQEKLVLSEKIWRGVLMYLKSISQKL